MLSFMMNLTVKEDCKEEAIESLSEIDRKANTHQGCINFIWFQHQENPLKFTLIEEWENQEVLDAHVEKIIDIWNEFKPCVKGEAVSTELNRLVERDT